MQGTGEQLAVCGLRYSMARNLPVCLCVSVLVCCGSPSPSRYLWRRLKGRILMTATKLTASDLSLQTLWLRVVWYIVQHEFRFPRYSGLTPLLLLRGPPDRGVARRAVVTVVVVSDYHRGCSWHYRPLYNVSRPRLIVVTVVCRTYIMSERVVYHCCECWRYRMYFVGCTKYMYDNTAW